ncbi:MAG TPA: FAD-binding protein, partial [Desulfobacteraceae bacterium]|nr:FAD-binding protein [Desulfobacteraceae bacterium]
YDTETQAYPRIPSYIIFDENGRKLYPIAMPTFNDSNVFYEWSEDNLAEVEHGILRKAKSIDDIASDIKVEPYILRETVERWNRFCMKNADDDFGRPAESMVPVETPPFYYAEVWPVVSNTHGGPAHNENWQVLDAFGKPIPGLYEAGELGGIFGFLYLAGGNLAECYIGGWTAGRHAAQNEPW